MYSDVSQDFKDAVVARIVTTKARLTFNNYFPSDDLILEGTDISDNGVKISDYCYKDGQLIGTAMTKEAEIEIINSNNYDLADKTFDLELGVLIDAENLTYEYVPYGEFTVTDYEDLKSNNKFKIIAYDNMDKLNSEFKDNEDFLPTIPCTLKEFYEDFMDSYGIDVVSQTLPNEDFIVTEMPNFDGYTGRTVLMKIAEIFGSFAKINRENKCEMFLKTTTNTQIPLTAMNSKLEINKQYGPVNVVSIGMSNVEGENVTLRDDASIEQYGEITIKIDDNPFLYTEEKREAAIQELYDRLHNFTYIPVHFNLKAPLYTDCGDSIQVRNMENTAWIDTMILNQNINVPRTRQSSIDTPALTNTQRTNQYISQSKQANTRTEILVDKLNQEIQLIASDVKNLTKTVKGTKSVVISDAFPDENLLELHIYGNNEVFDYLYPADDLYPANDLYPYGDSRIRLYNDKEDKTIDLGIDEVLRANNFVKDEVFIEEKNVYLIRRVNPDGTTKGTEVKTLLGQLDLVLTEGNNTIQIVNYSAEIEVKYVIKSTLTDIFAPRAEMNASITVKTDEINEEVRQKVGDEEIIAKFNAAIQDGQGIVHIQGNQVIIDSDNFTLSKTGVLTAKGANIQGSLVSYNYNTGYVGVKISNAIISMYDYINQDVAVGHISSVYTSDTQRSGISLTSFLGKDLFIGYQNSSDDRGVHGLIYYTDINENSLPKIKNTATGTLFSGLSGGGISVNNGLITNWDMTGTWSGTYYLSTGQNMYKVTVLSGLMTGIEQV